MPYKNYCTARANILNDHNAGKISWFQAKQRLTVARMEYIASR